MLGKSVTDLQSNISVGSNYITGTLKYVTGYTGFSGKVSEQSGNYLALKCEAEDADSITVEFIGGVSGKGEVTLDEDGIIILRVSNNAQLVKVRAYKDEQVANVQVFNLTGLVLSGE